MRLLQLSDCDEVTVTKDLVNNIPAYAILSHTWGEDEDEVTFDDIQNKHGNKKKGYAKIRFCAKQAAEDGLKYFWVDTCAINKANHSELSEAINSMFQWYRDAARCYVYLTDVSALDASTLEPRRLWEPAFRRSRWFQRGWTLQELLAPKSVRFFSKEGESLGTKETLQQLIHEITSIPLTALQGNALSDFSDAERLRWSENRQTQKPEDKAYCLLGIFGIFMSLIYGERDNAFVRLKEEIAKRSGSSSLNTHTHWIVTRSPNPLFTGREDILQELEKTVAESRAIKANHEQCRIVVCGMGGQGKSEVCLQLASRLRKSFWAVFWVDVSTTSVAEAAFLSIAERLSLPARTWDQACLSIANLKHSWLLVLDNADDLNTDYQQYIPGGSSGVVILTSRNVECQLYANSTSIDLEGLAQTEARDLLLKATRMSQEETIGTDVLKVTNLLQSHPLALIQAGAYISRGHCTLTQYPDVYKRQRQRLLTFRPTQARSRYRDVYATFEASAQCLRTSGDSLNQDALQLLPLLAMCDLNRFPLSMFEAAREVAREVPADSEDEAEDTGVPLLTPWHIARLPSFLNIQSQIWDPFRLEEAVNQLKAFALVSTDSSEGFLSLSMHPLIHAWARDRQSDTEQHQSWLQMATLFALFAYLRRGLPFRTRNAFRPHIEAVTEWKPEIMFGTEPRTLVSRVLVNCGWLLEDLRSDAKLSELLEKILDFLGMIKRKVMPQWIGLYALVAQNLRNQGKMRDAVLLYERILEIREQSLPENHRKRLNAQHSLAYAYLDNRQVDAATTLLEKVVTIRGQFLPEDNSELLESQHELARSYLRNKHVDAAVTLLEKVVKIQLQSLPEDHPDQLSSQQVLAQAYRRNGRLDEALALFEKVVKIQNQSLSENHPDQLSTLHDLAKLYKLKGQMDEAVALLEKVVRIQKQSLPEHHSDLLQSQHNLATYYSDRGQLDIAISMMKHVVETQRLNLDENHPDRKCSESWLNTMEKKKAKQSRRKRELFRSRSG